MGDFNWGFTQLAQSRKQRSSKLKAESSEKRSSKLKAESSKDKEKSSERSFEGILKGGGDMKFGYEDLEVWNKAVDFAVQVIEAVERISTDRKHYRLLEQIESS